MTNSPLSKLSFADAVLFDLDGTLWDITSLVAKARNNTYQKLGLNLPPVTREYIAQFIGLPADEIYRRQFPDWSHEKRESLRLITSQEIARLLPIDGGTLYPGVVEGLNTLKQHFRLFIVSNCGKGYIENFLAWSQLGHLFEGHECYGNTLRPKGENIASVVGRFGLGHPLYVGDTATDHTAANEAKVPYLHVDYGFGDPVEACPRFRSFPDLVSALLALTP